MLLNWTREREKWIGEQNHHLYSVTQQHPAIKFSRIPKAC
jgi:hypothetical protein